MRNLKNGQQRKQNKKMPKWQVFNQMAKIFLLQTNQLQIVVRYFLANKHSIVYCKGWFTIAEKPKPKSWSYPKACDKIKVKRKLKEN